MRRFQLDFDKAIEAILYIAPRVAKPTFHTLNKILYFADLDHLNNYGRLITGDQYIAMEFGPVPSAINDIMKVARGDGKRRFVRYTDSIKSAFEVPGSYSIRGLRDARTAVFSESDLECLDRSIAQHGNKTFGQLTDESHDAAWRATPEGKEMSLENIAGMFEDSESLLEHLGMRVSEESEVA